MFKDNLMMLRRLNGYSQETLAEKLNISRQAYAKWEKGQSVPDIERCALLAEIFGTTMDDLVHHEMHQAGMTIPPAPKGKHIFGTVTVNERGQIVIPKNARAVFDIGAGDRLILLGDEAEGLALVKAEVLEARMKTMKAGMAAAEEERD